MKNAEITREFVEEIRDVIDLLDEKRALELMENVHPADIALLYNELDIDEAKFLFLLLDGEKAADVLAELDEDDRERFLKELPSDVIARFFIENMETDDAADVLADMSPERKDEVLSLINDIEHAGDIVDLLDYNEDTAGGLMQKEFISVDLEWDVATCIEEIRKQAEDVDEIYNVYVIENQDIFKGVLSLKKLIISKPEMQIKEIYNSDAIVVKTNTPAYEIVNLMDKYDLISLPVVDSIGRIVGRITIDDVIDVLREKSEKDYQMASGLSEDVEFSDNVWRMTRARLPWLLIGLVGEVFNSRVIGLFEGDLTRLATAAFFLPLIAATGGNVGIQSSAIVVQAIANGSLGIQSFWKKLVKDFAVSLLNALSLSLIIFLYSSIFIDSQIVTYAVSIALFVVVVFASIFGIVIPMALNKMKIDPAIATGPFITITNDIIGMAIYLSIVRLLSGILS